MKKNDETTEQTTAKSSGASGEKRRTKRGATG